MGALLPHSALRLLSIMERQHLLTVRTAAEPHSCIPVILKRPSQPSAQSQKVRVPKDPMAEQILAGYCINKWALSTCIYTAMSFNIPRSVILKSSNVLQQAHSQLLEA